MSLILKIAELSRIDADKGIVKIDPRAIKELKISSGDGIELSNPINNKKTIAVAFPSFTEEFGSGTIRLDAQLRKNLGLGLDDNISIQKIKLQYIDSIDIAPIGLDISFENSSALAYFLEDRAIMKGDYIKLDSFGNSFQIKIANFSPVVPYGQIRRTTKFNILPKIEEGNGNRAGVITYDDIGGLGDTISKLREMVELPIRHPEIFKRLGITPPKGVLLHGPPGTGKTLIAKAIANETNAKFYSIKGPEIMNKYYGQSEENLRNIFDEAKSNAPSIIFIDEIDSIAPKRDDVKGEVERRVVSQLLTLMDGLDNRGDVVVIGATNRPNSIDDALRRGGRFDREIEIGAPDKEGRLEIMQIHTRGMPLNPQVSLKEIADRAHGFVGADIYALCKEAGLIAIKRIIPSIDLSAQEIPLSILQTIELTKADFDSAFLQIEPSAMREFTISVPTEKWEDIGGLSNVVNTLRESVELPIKSPELFKKLGITPPKGIILYGPSGTGKTMIVKALAHESELNFISIKGSELDSQWYGETENALRNIFRKARQSAPCIIFIDEIDSFTPKREGNINNVDHKVVGQLLALMDGLESRGDVIVIGATNRIDDIDPALRRGGRFDLEIEVGAPDKNGRLEILKIHTKKMPIDSDVNLPEIAEKIHGFVGSDIYSLCKEAGMVALRRSSSVTQLSGLKVTKADFDLAMTKVEPSALREFIITKPKETWDDIGGLKNVKEIIQEAIESKIKYPNLCKALKVNAPKGILLYGLPGTGKTLIAKASANSCGANFISVKGPEIMNKWVGESEKAIRKIFKSARQSAPCIIFFDEIDSIASIRSAGNGVNDQVVSQILTELDGIEELKNVFVMFATNRPDIIDPALLRSGRIGVHVEIPLPDEDTRVKILEIHTKNRPLDKLVDLKLIAKKMDKSSGADLEALCNEATNVALRECLKEHGYKDLTDSEIKNVKITMKHFESAIITVQKSMERSNRAYAEKPGAIKNPMYS